MHGFAAALGLLLPFVPAAHAQSMAVPPPMFGTTYVSSLPTFAQGRPTGCALQFKVLARDVVYRRGEPVFIHGAFGLIKGQAEVLSGYSKVSMTDFSLAQGRFVETHVRPSRVNVLTLKGATTADSLVHSAPGDPPTHLFTIFKLEPTMDVIVQALQANAVTIAVARDEGSLDLAVPVDLDVVDMTKDGRRTRDPKEMLLFAQCLKLLLQ